MTESSEPPLATGSATAAVPAATEVTETPTVAAGQHVEVDPNIDDSDSAVGDDR